MTSRLRGKGSGGSALRLSPCEHSMAREQGQGKGLWAVAEVAQGAFQGVLGTLY